MLCPALRAALRTLGGGAGAVNLGQRQLATQATLDGCLADCGAYGVAGLHQASDFHVLADVAVRRCVLSLRVRLTMLAVRPFI
jgi:hypothetical protein